MAKVRKRYLVLLELTDEHVEAILRDGTHSADGDVRVDLRLISDAVAAMKRAVRERWGRPSR